MQGIQAGRRRLQAGRLAGGPPLKCPLGRFRGLASVSSGKVKRIPNGGEQNIKIKTIVTNDSLIQFQQQKFQIKANCLRNTIRPSTDLQDLGFERHS
jgi:hypothetical protein